MRTPVGPYGKHARLQHSPPHVGSPTEGSYIAPSEHTSPALRQPVSPVAVATAQTPSVAPFAIVQRPPQHSLAARQVSPTCRQYDGDGEQSPSTQYLEQHWVGLSHGLPDVRHSPFSGAHTSFVQVPPQHSSFEVQASLSATH
jgi:hypothetical protein